MPPCSCCLRGHIIQKPQQIPSSQNLTGEKGHVTPHHVKSANVDSAVIKKDIASPKIHCHPLAASLSSQNKNNEKLKVKAFANNSAGCVPIHYFSLKKIKPLKPICHS